MTTNNLCSQEDEAGEQSVVESNLGRRTETAASVRGCGRDVLSGGISGEEGEDVVVLRA